MGWGRSILIGITCYNYKYNKEKQIQEWIKIYHTYGDAHTA